MATIEALPAVVASLGATLTSLPATLTSVNTSHLSSLFSELALDLEPALPSLGAAQQEALLSNTTWLAAQSGQLSAVAAQLPPAELRDLSHDSLLQLIKIASTRYSIMTVHAPEIWSTLLLFAIAAGTKVALCALLSSTAICRAQDVLCKRLGGEADRDLARAKLQKPARAALGHLSNLLLGTVALVMQLVAWRLFVLPSQPIQYADYAWFSLALKLVLVGYGADLLFGDVRPEIYLHHFFTFALLFVGQLAVFETKSPKFFRLAQYLILQATTEQSTYASMVAYHFFNYLRVQNHRPELQRRLLVVTHTLLRFTRYITFPQKLVPCAFAVYWLARMWTEIDDKAWGRAWIVWCTTILSLLMILQIRFCDDTWPLAAHIGYKLHGGPLPPRQGPVMRFLARMFCCRRTRRSNVRPAAPPTVDSYNSSLKLDVDAKEGSVVAAEEGRSRVTTMLGAERGEASVAELLELRKMVDQSTVSSRVSSRRSLDTAWSTPFRPLSLPHLDKESDAASTHLSDLPSSDCPGSATATANVWVVIDKGTTEKKDGEEKDSALQVGADEGR